MCTVIVSWLMFNRLSTKPYETTSEMNKNCIGIFQLLKYFQLYNIKLPSVALLHLNCH